jgi:hypothetical protein
MLLTLSFPNGFEHFKVCQIERIFFSIIIFLHTPNEVVITLQMQHLSI